MPGFAAVLAVVSSGAVLLQGCGGGDAADPRPKTTCSSGCEIEYECHGDHIHLGFEKCGDSEKPKDPKGTCEAYKKEWDGKKKEEQECASAGQCCHFAGDDADDDCKKAASLQCSDPRPKTTCSSGCEIKYDCHGDHMHLHFDNCGDAEKPKDPEGTCEAYKKEWDDKSTKDQQCASATECCHLAGEDAEKDDCKKKEDVCKDLNDFDKFVARRSVETVV